MVLYNVPMVEISKPGDKPKDQAAKIQQTAETLAQAAQEAGVPPVQAIESAQDLANRAHGVNPPAESED